MTYLLRLNGGCTKLRVLLVALSISGLLATVQLSPGQDGARLISVDGAWLSDKVESGQTDWFTFLAHKEGEHIIETSGYTRVKLVLHGPGSQDTTIPIERSTEDLVNVTVFFWT